MGAGLSAGSCWWKKTQSKEIVSLTCHSLSDKDLEANMEKMQKQWCTCDSSIPDSPQSESKTEISLPDPHQLNLARLKSESLNFITAVLRTEIENERVNADVNEVYFSQGAQKVLDIGEDILDFSFTHAEVLRARLSELTLDQRCDLLFLLHGRILDLAWEITIGNRNKNAELTRLLTSLLDAKRAYEDKYMVVLSALYNDCGCETDELWQVLRNNPLNGIQKRWEQLEINC